MFLFLCLELLCLDILKTCLKLSLRTHWNQTPDYGKAGEELQYSVVS